LAGVDSADVIRGLPALLAPLSFLLSYGAGAALFRSWAGGVAALAGTLALYAFPANGVGIYTITTGPSLASVMLLLPALLALVFAFTDQGRRSLLVSLGAAGFALAVVHPTYVLFVAVPLLGFLAARLVLARSEVSDAARTVQALAAVVVPGGLFLVWLFPTVRSTPSFTPGEGEKTRQLVHYANQLDMFGDSFRLAPEAISTSGPLAVAALVAVPLAVVAPRTRWAAFVLGSAVAVLALALTPPLFTTLTDYVSISQGRRLLAFLPWSFAFAGAAFVLARFRLVGCLAALAAGITLLLLYPGDFTYASSRGGGPVWPVWVAVVGGAVGLLVAAGAARAWRPRWVGSAPWAALVALAFVVPIAAVGLPDIQRAKQDRHALSPGLVEALRTQVRPGDVVFSTEEASYRIVAYAPVYVASAKIGHVWDRPYERVADAERFFVPTTSEAEGARILRKYDSDWLVIDTRLPIPAYVESLDEPTYTDRRYMLYRVNSA
jgi:hypothetical protein